MDKCQPTASKDSVCVRVNDLSQSVLRSVMPFITVLSLHCAVTTTTPLPAIWLQSLINLPNQMAACEYCCDFSLFWTISTFLILSIVWSPQCLEKAQRLALFIVTFSFHLKKSSILNTSIPQNRLEKCHVSPSAVLMKTRKKIPNRPHLCVKENHASLKCVYTFASHTPAVFSCCNRLKINFHTNRFFCYRHVLPTEKKTHTQKTFSIVVDTYHCWNISLIRWNNNALFDSITYTKMYERNAKKKITHRRTQTDLSTCRRDRGFETARTHHRKKMSEFQPLLIESKSAWQQITKKKTFIKGAVFFTRAGWRPKNGIFFEHSGQIVNQNCKPYHNCYFNAQCTLYMYTASESLTICVFFVGFDGPFFIERVQWAIGGCQIAKCWCWHMVVVVVVVAVFGYSKNSYHITVVRIIYLNRKVYICLMEWFKWHPAIVEPWLF